MDSFDCDPEITAVGVFVRVPRVYTLKVANEAERFQGPGTASGPMGGKEKGEPAGSPRVFDN